MISALFFYLFASVAVASAVMVISSRNPVHSVLFLILWFVRTRLRQPNGVLTGLFFFCYAIFRIVVEYFREPDATLIGGFTRGQFFSFFLIAIGVAYIVVAKMRPAYPKRMPRT